MREKLNYILKSGRLEWRDLGRIANNYLTTQEKAEAWAEIKKEGIDIESYIEVSEQEKNPIKHLIKKKAIKKPDSRKRELVTQESADQ